MESLWRLSVCECVSDKGCVIAGVVFSPLSFFLTHFSPDMDCVAVCASQLETFINQTSQRAVIRKKSSHETIHIASVSMSESVYALIQPEASVAARAPRFKSRDAPAPTASTFGFHGTSVVLGNVAGSSNIITVHPSQKKFATFGRGVSNDVDPATFLKKGAAAVTSESVQSADGSKVVREKVKAPIPKRDEKPVMGLKTDKNFVVANAVENILTVPKKQSSQKQRAVDRDDYGRVPQYIHQIKSELKDQYALVDSYKQRKAQEEEKFAELSPSEIQELRSGLQRRWEVLNKEFQTMGFSVETYSQKRHQEEVEAELRSVEAALHRVSKSRIFVYDDAKQ